MKTTRGKNLTLEKREIQTMKKYMLLLPLLAFILFAGCESRLFHFVITHTLVGAFEVDQTGAFTEVDVFGPDDINEALELPEGARITEVNVEGAYIEINITAGNQADNVVVNADIREVGTGTWTHIFQNLNIDIQRYSNPQVINTLLPLGIALLNTKINGYVDQINDQNFELRLFGDSDPPGQHILLDVALAIRYTVKYDQCMEVPSGLGGGEPCPDDM